MPPQPDDRLADNRPTKMVGQECNSDTGCNYTLPILPAPGDLVRVGIEAADLLVAGWRWLFSAENVAKFDWSRAQHIFRDAEGHINPATAAERAWYAALFTRVASDINNLRQDAVAAGIISQQAADAGVKAYTWLSQAGPQVWVTVRNGIVLNAGINLGGATR